MSSRQLLILGGTGEARMLAEQAVSEFGTRLRVVTSLAGRTAEPVPLAGEVRRGGFGGITGLTTYLRSTGVDMLIDATHPFAAQISHHAVEAAAAAAIPRLVLARPPWQRQPGDTWIEVDDAAAALAATLPSIRRIWLTVGRGDLAVFSGRPDLWFLVRRVDPPEEPLPLANYGLLLGRGPFAIADERRVLAEHRIEALIARASGGGATEAKLVAAREAGLPVIMIRRPAAPPGPQADSPAAALAWLRERIGA